jgi:hypothetical protein
MTVLFLPEVEEYLYELIEVLYYKDYFGFKDSAINYVTDLKNDIKKHLANKVKHPAPRFFNKYGKKMLYASFRKSKTTQWYVFFNIYEHNGKLIYLVRYIGNNHVIAQYL